METVFKDFKETIEVASDRGEFPDAAKLIVLGKIEYAMERGDLTVNQAWELTDLLGDDFKRRYVRASEIASFGESNGEVLSNPVPPVPVPA